MKTHARTRLGRLAPLLALVLAAGCADLGVDGGGDAVEIVVGLDPAHFAAAMLSVELDGRVITRARGLIEREEPLMWRIAAGCVIGSAVFGTVAFVLALAFGLTPLTVVFSLLSVVAAGFFVFAGLLIYLGVPQRIAAALDDLRERLAGALHVQRHRTPTRPSKAASRHRPKKSSTFPRTAFRAETAASVASPSTAMSLEALWPTQSA